LINNGVSDLAVFPLNAVLFPGGLLPLRVFEQRYMDMVAACLKHQEPFGVCLIRSGHEVGAPASPQPVGCTARIVDWDMQQLGMLSIKAHGEQRFRIVESRITDAALIRASVELLPADDDSELPERYDDCAKLLKAVIDEHGSEFVVPPLRFESSSWVSARLAEILPVPLAAKQKLLEIQDASERIEILSKFLQQHRLST
jgi:uncharacterized protein